MESQIIPIANTTGEPDLRYARDERKAQVMCVRLRPRFGREIAAFARTHGMTRTTVVEEALRFYMAVKGLDGESPNGNR